MRTLYESRHARLEIDDVRGLVRYTRSSVPFESLADVEAMFRELASANTTIDRTHLVLLSDVRAAPGRNDEAFESVVGAVRAQLVERFEKRALLLRTVVGVMQTQRMERTFGGPHIEPFADEAAALAYLGVT